MAKGNDGSAARRRTTKKLLAAAACALAIVATVAFFGSPPAGQERVEIGYHGHEGERGLDSYEGGNPRRRKHHKHHKAGRREDREPGGEGGGHYNRNHNHNDNDNNGERRHKHHKGEKITASDYHRAEIGRRNAEGATDRRHQGRHGFGGIDDDLHARMAKRFRPRGQREPGSLDDGSESGSGDAARAITPGSDDHGLAGFRAWKADRPGEPSESESQTGDDRPYPPPALLARIRRELIEESGEGATRGGDVLDAVLAGSTHLVSIGANSRLGTSRDGSYQGVTGRFCRLDFGLHKKDPSKYPMFRFLLQGSPDCANENQVSFDLRKLAVLARHADRAASERDGEAHALPRALNLTAVAFHESRCGSTLVANSMIAMDPEKHRAYSESSPPVAALHICGDYFHRCTREQAASVLRDTIYLMSRTDDPLEERVFFKFQSITSKAIPTFQMAFPEVPWMYVYRDPVQVMMSHVKDDPSLKRAICTKTRGKPPRELVAIARRHGRRGADDLEPSEYCAAHLAQLTEAAVENLNDMAIPVPYDRLPDMMWETIMPKIFGRPLEQFEIDNLKEISKSYSKQGKGKNKDKQGEFKGDSEQKEKKASDAIRNAAKEFLKESFDQLGAFRSRVLE